MNLYDFFMKPFEDGKLNTIRKKLIGEAEGVILELGVGTGVNLDKYNYSNIEQLLLTDLEIREIVRAKYKKLPDSNKIKYVEGDVQKIELDDNSVDTVVSTLVFCSVNDVQKGLMEIKRVLKPTGKLIFIEHVISPNKKLASAMNFLTPAWKRIAGNCHLNRDYIDSLVDADFNVTKLEKSFKKIFVSGIAELRG